MDCLRKVFSSSREEKITPSFLRNGGELLQGLIALSDGNDRHINPIRNFSAKELIKSTNNFADTVSIGGTGKWFKGSLEQRPILVKKFFFGHWNNIDQNLPYAVNDIVIASQMSHLKNVLKLLGCCLEMEIPALVYDYSGNDQVLHDLLQPSTENVVNDPLLSSWKRRLRIANSIAQVMVYLHTAFPTPIIHRDLNLRNIFVDQYGIAKLVDFSFCVSLPQGESQVEGQVIGTFGFADPEYVATGIITEKTSVYAFGIILLVLLTGRRKWENIYDSILVRVKNLADNKTMKEILDPAILKSDEGAEEQELEQIKAFFDLTLACTQREGVHRPEMIRVAKELKRIERSIHA